MCGACSPPGSEVRTVRIHCLVSAHGVFAQRQRPKGHGQNSTIKISMSQSCPADALLMCRRHAERPRTSAVCSKLSAVQDRTAKNDSMHSVSASGSMHGCDPVHLNSCVPVDVRACPSRRARSSRSFCR